MRRRAHRSSAERLTNANPGLPTNFFDNDANTTTKPNKSILVTARWIPTFYPYVGNLTDGQKYGDVTTATHVELVLGNQSG